MRLTVAAILVVLSLPAQAEVHVHVNKDGSMEISVGGSTIQTETMTQTRAKQFAAFMAKHYPPGEAVVPDEDKPTGCGLGDFFKGKC